MILKFQAQNKETKEIFPVRSLGLMYGLIQVDKKWEPIADYEVTQFFNGDWVKV